MPRNVRAEALPEAVAETRDDFRATVAAFHRHLRAEGRSPETVKAYAKATDQLYAFLAAEGMPRTVEHIHREHVEAWMVHLQGRGLADATIAQRYRSLDSFFSWATGADVIRVSPMERMKPPKVAMQRTPILEDEQIAAILGTCAGKSFSERRDTAIIVLFFATGVRLAELSNLVLDDVDLDARRMQVIGKGAKPRTVPYTAEAATALDRYLIARSRHPHGASPWLWIGENDRLTASGVAQVVKRRARMAGLDVHPHQFRHTFAARWMEAGGPEQSLLEIAGWSSPEMLNRYGRATRAARAQTHYETFAPTTKRR